VLRGLFLPGTVAAVVLLSIAVPPLPGRPPAAPPVGTSGPGAGDADAEAAGLPAVDAVKAIADRAPAPSSSGSGADALSRPASGQAEAERPAANDDGATVAALTASARLSIAAAGAASPQGRECHLYRVHVSGSGIGENGKATVCRGPAGDWRVVKYRRLGQDPPKRRQVALKPAPERDRR